MKAPRLRAWNPDIKVMELPEDIFTRDCIHILLNEEDYIWMRSIEREDCERNEIFAGDIIQSFITLPMEVFWSQNDMAFYVRYITEENNIATQPISILEHEWDTVTVIGNIYENPELIGKQE